MTNTEPISEQLSNYISTTRAAIDKLTKELEIKQTLDVERLELYIKYQQQACLDLISSVDQLLGRSKDG